MTRVNGKRLDKKSSKELKNRERSGLLKAR
jgi:hypothetical protein